MNLIDSMYINGEETFDCDRTQITYFSITDMISKIGSFYNLITLASVFIVSFFIYDLFAKDMARKIFLENFNSSQNNQENI